MKFRSVICLIFISSSAAASSSNAIEELTTLTVKNMTDSSLIIQSELVNGFIGNLHIQINGMSTMTPVETIPSQGSGKFTISDNGLNGVITGGINLCVQGTQACGYFPMWAGGNGQDHTIVINAPLNSTSNSQYIVGAYEVDEADAVLNVYTAMKRK